jgi:hypothetical protein
MMLSTKLFALAAKTPVHHVQQASATTTVTASLGVLLLAAAFVMWRMGNATLPALLVGIAAGAAMPTLGGTVLGIFSAVAHAVSTAANSVGG